MGRSHGQSMGMKFVVQQIALSAEFCHLWGQHPIRRTVRRESGRRIHRVVPIRCPDAIGLAWACFPGKHRFIKRNIQRVAQCCEHATGILEYITRVDHGGHRPMSRQLLEEPHLLGQPGRIYVRVIQDTRQREQHRPWLTNEHAVAQLANPGCVHSRQQVMSHVFLVEDRTTGRQIGEQRRNDPGRIGLMMVHDLTSPGMCCPGLLQIMGIQRLIAHNRIAPAPPRPHHRRRDIARAGPHGNPCYVGHRFAHARSVRRQSLECKIVCA